MSNPSNNWQDTQIKQIELSRERTEASRRNDKANFMKEFLFVRAGTDRYDSSNCMATLECAAEAWHALERVRLFGKL